jgi:hypothetical protein
MAVLRFSDLVLPNVLGREQEICPGVPDVFRYDPVRVTR